MDTPGAASASVFKVLLAIEMAMLSATSGRTLLPEICLADSIAVEDVSFTTLFVVQDE